MSKFNSFSFSLIAALSLSSAAFAAPPEPTDNSEILAEKIEDKLADHQGDIARSAQTVLSFDGAEVGKIEHNSSRDSEDTISISGLGKSLSLDRQTIIKDGKSKTRIVIEMDGADEIDITLPDLD